MTLPDLRDIAYKSLLELATDEGIYASSKEGAFGCIFGRDSAITCLKILRVLETYKGKDQIDTLRLKAIVRNSLIKITALQGKEENRESGEQPGKFIHEFRKDKYERLVNRPRPWYVYPDKILRNYDSIDSTPLGLIAIYNYWKITGDKEFLLTTLPAVEKGLIWIKNYGDMDGDHLLEYELSEERIHGGLRVQSWTDSAESLLSPDGMFPLYPIAPVEVQGYAWLALKLWGEFFIDNPLVGDQTKFAKELLDFSKKIKKAFNEKFIFHDGNDCIPAQALDGNKNQIKTLTGNPLLLLWATFQNNDTKETILNDKFIPYLIKRSFEDDMFDSEAGIRTMSTRSITFNPKVDSYHNGSFWPKLNGMAHEGLEKWGFIKEADMLRNASIKPIIYFGSPVELYIKDQTGKFILYKNARGQESCRVQAWSAAALLDFLKHE